MNYDYIARKEHYGWLTFNTITHQVDKVEANQIVKLQKEHTVKIFQNPLVKGALTAPLKLFINVSNQCNLKCIHCFSDSSPQSKEAMPLEMIKSLISEAATMGVFLIIIGGGEPFMRTDLWEIIAFIRQKGMGVSLTTNGTIFNEKIITNLKKYQVRLNVSFDGKPETHDFIRQKKGTFEKTAKNLKIFKNYGLHPTIRYTLMTLNIKDVPFILNFARSMQLPIKVRRAKPADRAINNNLIITNPSKDYFKAIMLMNKDKNCNVEDIMSFTARSKQKILISDSDCGAATRVMFVEANGTINPCSFLGKNFFAGNYHNQSLYDIWNNSKNFIKMRSIPLNKDCKICNRRKKCHAECPAIRLHVGGSIYAKDPACLQPCFDEIYPCIDLEKNV